MAGLAIRERERSQDPRVDGILERLLSLYPRAIDLDMGRLLTLLGKLGDPHQKLAPVLHVAGTNGKGSTCAFARAIAEAAGLRVQVYTSPHLVDFNERIRLADGLVSHRRLADTLELVERANDGAPITVFEVITAAAFVLFAEDPADLCILEVGLGGRGDATNVVDRPAACAITSISIDHRDFLGDSLTGIAAEKAGIIKPGVPVVTGVQKPEVLAVFTRIAAERGAPFAARGEDWHIAPTADGLDFTDTHGSLALPFPSLVGPHQYDNAGIAVAALRASGLMIPDRAFATGLARAEWAGRMQRLGGPLASLLPTDWELWLDGAHNPGAGAALAQHLTGWADRPLHLVIGMKQGKDAAEFLKPILPFAASVWAVAEPEQHLALSVEDVILASGGAARAGGTVAEALSQLAAEAAAAPARVLVCGSLYLAGALLRQA
ncbi:bifunctional folylpolyglutamate synthase/dihydrofolate synthase [Acidisoma silvae]|uniref:Dihydrofolate synthase/folylpolyglutamate synthase n=1 Tax=Acidisoma silvae TaxID=2802396 RepID=A0A963YP79_9PROT|nr:folylpolyglutamate synthase/dihydrofolate synthase family protein [Acidisoma silvae]MCB8874103.1 bifunctional folylpolyglutamate synthase/dihydrofolate synthase [Acidisoma silvae]